MSGSEAMKPCPFCGGDTHMIMVPAPRHGMKTLYRPQCKKCGCDLGGFDTVALAVEAWNRRVAQGWHADEMIVEPVARAIYCASRPDLAYVWKAECQETRLYYFDLASAAIKALPI